MIITYNCALDVLVNLERIDEAIDMFETIDKLYSADLVSYSTIIKGLCKVDRKNKALSYVKKMLESSITVDVSVVNLFLDCCANYQDYRLGIKGYQLADTHKIRPNEVTFGIMIKIYGFSRELGKAFETLGVMKAYGIKPSIIVFTNLVHISFYSRNLKRVEEAYRLFKREKLKGDRLLYSKLIDGFLRNRDPARALKYLNFAHQEKVPLKPDVCDKLEKVINPKDSTNLGKLQDCRKFKHYRVAPTKRTNHRKELVSDVGDRKSTYSQRDKFFKKSDRKQRGFGNERSGNARKFGNSKYNSGYKKQGDRPKTLTLFNFRKKATNNS
jgi:pentatricopeptide repeat protein